MTIFSLYLFIMQHFIDNLQIDAAPNVPALKIRL